MKLYLPEIYPDELAYSWFSRYAIHSGFTVNNQVVSALYCKESDRTRKEFIGNLNTEARNCIIKMYSMEYIVLNHTMYSQYARFISLQQKNDTLYKLCYGNYDVCHLFRITPRCDKEQCLKYCPICASEDRKKYGETYWHRKHQIRNMMICPKHRCKLEDSQVTAKNKDSKFIAAENTVPHTGNFISINDPLQIQFSKYLEDIFDAPMDFQNDVPPEAILYYYIKGTNYMKSQKHHNRSKFIKDFYQYYSKIQLNETLSQCRIENTLRGSMYTFSTICQIGFFLQIPANELVKSKLSKKHVQQEKSIHYVEPNWKQYDAVMAKAMEKAASDIYYGHMNEFGRPDKVMERNICRKLNIMFNRIKNMPQCKSILDKYSEPYPELWARRLIWAYDKLTKERGEGNFYWTDMKMITNMLKTKFDETIPYLKKHTDDEKAEKIIKLVYPK